MKVDESQKRCRLLAEKIATILKSGLRLNRDARHYIDSTFSTPSLEELEKILNDESNCETEPLRELIFFPDEAIQIELEDLLERFRFEKKDEQKILNLILSQKLAAALVFANSKKELNLELPPASAAGFISRLNISKKIDQRLMKAIDQHVDEKYRTRFKVKLRNSRFDYSDNKTAFLEIFFAELKAEINIVSACFEYLLAFFDELKDDGDIYGGLMEKKRFYFQNLQKALKADAQFEKSNMETLFLQGVRMSYFDKEDACRKIALIDRLSLAVFGKTEHIDPAAMDIDLGEFNRENGLKKMFRILS